jgi:hypothetical protein
MEEYVPGIRLSINPMLTEKSSNNNETPRSKLTGYQEKYFLRGKLRGIYPKRLKKIFPRNTA